VNTTEDLIAEPVARQSAAGQVLTLAWPVVVEQLLGTAVALTNTYIVGHLGAASLAAVGLSGQLNALLQSLFVAVGVGSTALVARHIGAGEPREAGRTGGQSLLLAGVVGLIAALPCLLWGGQLLAALGGAEDVVQQGRTYLQAAGTTMPFMAVLFIGNAVLRGSGDTRRPMAVMAAVNLVDATVSWSLVNGLGPLPELGVLGAGIGWACGMTVGGLSVGWILLRGRSSAPLRVMRQDLRPDLGRTWRLLRIGLPSGAEQMVMRVAQLAMATVVTRLGTTVYAGHQLGIQLLSVAFMPGQAFSVAATTLVGQELGRNAPARAEACARAASRMALAVMCSMGAAAFLLSGPLLRAFTTDPGVVAQGLIALVGCALAEPALSYCFVLGGALRGAGDTRYALLAQATPIWLVRLPLAYGLGIAAGLGLAGVWAAMILDVTARAALLGLRFRRGAWKELAI